MTDNDLSVGGLIAAATIAMERRQRRTRTSAADLDAEINRLGLVYGVKEVRAAAARLPAAKTGRKEERDWPLLSKVLTQDARDWLDGKDPARIRSNYKIAVAFAKAHPGHNAAATQRRIMLKLARKRTYYFHFTALQISEDERPFSVYFRAVVATVALADEKLGKMIQDDADRRLGKLQRYRDLIGEPAPEWTVKQIEKELDEILTRRSALGADPITLLHRLAGLTSAETARS